MEVKAILVDIMRNWRTKKLRLTFEIEEDPTEAQIEGITGKLLRLKVVLFKKKRSLNANGYAWELMQQIAQHPSIKSTKEEIYEIALRDEGVPEEDENGYITIEIPAQANINKIPGHWRRISTETKTALEDGEIKKYLYSKYINIKGSSQYNTQEMSVLIDYLVEQARDLGIDTMTPDEIARLKSLWKPEGRQ